MWFILQQEPARALLQRRQSTVTSPTSPDAPQPRAGATHSASHSAEAAAPEEGARRRQSAIVPMARRESLAAGGDWARKGQPHISDATGLVRSCSIEVQEADLCELCPFRMTAAASV